VVLKLVTAVRGGGFIGRGADEEGDEAVIVSAGIADALTRENVARVAAEKAVRGGSTGRGADEEDDEAVIVGGIAEVLACIDRFKKM
jgi:F0F1-type ATP synthase epsilon subunit